MDDTTPYEPITRDQQRYQSKKQLRGRSSNSNLQIPQNRTCFLERGARDLPVSVIKKQNSSDDTLRKKKLEGYIDYPNKYTPSAGKGSPVKKPDNPPRKFYQEQKSLSRLDLTQSHQNLRELTNPKKIGQLNLEPSLTGSVRTILSAEKKNDWCDLTVKGNGSFRVCKKSSLRDTVKTPSDIIVSDTKLGRDS
jgi:hypothetical protein